MSSMCTIAPPVSNPARSSRPLGALRAAMRSASDSAAQTHTTSSSATADRPDTRPPPPRRTVREPSSSAEKLTGPRLDARSTEADLGPLMAASLPVGAGATAVLGCAAAGGSTLGQPPRPLDTAKRMIGVTAVSQPCPALEDVAGRVVARPYPGPACPHEVQRQTDHAEAPSVLGGVPCFVHQQRRMVREFGVGVSAQHDVAQRESAVSPRRHRQPITVPDEEPVRTAGKPGPADTGRGHAEQGRSVDPVHEFAKPVPHALIVPVTRHITD